LQPSFRDRPLSRRTRSNARLDASTIEDPTDSGFGYLRDRRVALGHARLSIIDLTTGDQPIASEDGRTRIIVNGEFYGFEEIQQELERSWPSCPSSIRRRWWNCSIAWTRWTRVPVWRTIRS
jgi:hypothetical protein